MKSWSLVLLLASSVAAAQPMLPPDGLQTLTRLTIETELGRHRMLAPVTIAPDVAVGITETWAVMLHSSRAASAQIGAGGGICVQGARETIGNAPPRCERRIVDPGVSALARLSRSTVARLGVYVGDPEIGVLAGVLGRWGGRRWFVSSSPTIVAGLTARATANTDRLRVPVYGCHGRDRATLCVRSGIEAAFATFDETFAVPVGVAASLRVARVEVGVEATLDRALGPLNAMAWRSASLYVQRPFGGGDAR